MKYSVLCDTNPRVYREYLAASLLLKHGISIVNDLWQCGGSGVGQNGHRDVDVVGGVVVDVGNSLFQRGSRDGLLDSGAVDAGIHGTPVGCAGGASGCGTGPGTGVSGVRDGGDGSFVASSDPVSGSGTASGAVGGLPLGGGADVPQVSAKTLANRKRRQEKKELKQARQAGMKRDDWRKVQVVVSEKSELQKSLEAKWKVSNELAVQKLEREKLLFEAQDVEELKKMQRSKVLKATEKNLVAVEMAHGTLKNTGNVPGFCKTVVSDAVPSLSSGSISPNSSVSEAEVRRMAQRLEDLETECARLKRVNRDYALEKFDSGETVAFTADNYSEGLQEEVLRRCEGVYVMENDPADPDTIYLKRGEGVTVGQGASKEEKRFVRPEPTDEEKVNEKRLARDAIIKQMRAEGHDVDSIKSEDDGGISFGFNGHF